jgi:nucleoside-diphosphate-sugar epimerase
MKIFLTGGTGFIGANFINAAHAAGHEIVAIKRVQSKTSLPLNQEPTWVEGSLDADWRTALTGCDVLVHLASHTANPPYDTLANCLYWNVYASLRLAEQAHEVGVQRFLVAGSCFEYGASASRYQRIPVTALLDPTLSYPSSKAAASVAFQGFAAEHGLQVKILRLFQVYGEGERETRLWPSLHRAALEGRDFPMSLGEQVRDFIDVKDVAKAFVSALDFSDTEAGIARLRNLGTGKAQTLREFAEHWWRHWQAPGQLQFGALPYRKNELMRLIPEVDCG